MNQDSDKSLIVLGNLADLSSGLVTYWASWGAVYSETGDSRDPKQCSLWNAEVPRITETHGFLECKMSLTEYDLLKRSSCHLPTDRV